MSICGLRVCRGRVGEGGEDECASASAPDCVWQTQHPSAGRLKVSPMTAQAAVRYENPGLIVIASQARRVGCDWVKK